MPIEEFYQHYKRDYSTRNKKPSTLIKDDTIWETFKQVCPEIFLAEQIDDDVLNNYMERRKNNGSLGSNRPLRKASINREIGMLKNLARWGYKKHYLSTNCRDLVDTYPETDSQEKRPFTDDEIQKIMDNTSYPQREAHILSILHGMRGGEICALECDNFIWKEENPNIETDFITIRNKPHLQLFVKTKFSERDIPIHPFWREHLRAIWLKAKEKSGFFLLTYQHKPLTAGGLSSYTRKLFTQLGFPAKEISFHSGRHTCATRAKDGGYTIDKTSKNLGHSNARITVEVYTAYKPHEHFDIVDHIKIDIKKPEDLL